jgi:hypothetical protein
MQESESLDPVAVPELVEGFLWEELDDGCVLYHEATGKMVTLNGAAEAVLSCCGDGVTVADVLRLAAGEFAMPEQECAEAVKILRREGVIRLRLPS